MLKSITVTNYKGRSLKLPLDDYKSSGFIVKDINGVGAPMTDVMISSYAVLDGSYYNRSKAKERTITLELIYYGVVQESVSYSDLEDKPKINGVTVVNDKTSEDYGLSRPMKALTISDYDALLRGTFVPTFRWTDPDPSLMKEFYDGSPIDDLTGSSISYNSLYDKPRINGVMLHGNRSITDLGFQPAMTPLTEEDVDAIIDGTFEPKPSATLDRSDPPLKSNWEDYSFYKDKMKINGVSLYGDKTGKQLGIQNAINPLSEDEIKEILGA